MKKILIAIDLATDVARYVLDKATAASGADDRLEVVHVVDPASISYSIDPTMTGHMQQQLYEQTMANAQARLAEVCEPYGLAADQLHVRYGRVAHEVHALLEEGGFDACMVGSHGHSGWHRILGSKASSILHGVPVNTWVFSLSGMKKD